MASAYLLRIVCVFPSALLPPDPVLSYELNRSDFVTLLSSISLERYYATLDSIIEFSVMYWWIL